MARRRSKPTTEIATPSRDDGGGMARPAVFERRDLADILEEQRARWPKTIRRKELVRQMLSGELQAPILKSFVDAGAEFCRVDGVAKYHRSRDVVSVYAKQCPEVVRYHRIGTGPAIRATEIEQGVGAIMSAEGKPYGFPRSASVDLLVNEGCSMVIVQPVMTYWTRIDEELYEHYEEYTGSDGEIRRRPSGPIKAKFRRDSEGRAENDPYYRSNKKRKLVPHKTQSLRAMEAYNESIRMEHLPIIQRALSIDQAIPIFGEGNELRAAIVATEYAVTDLEQRYTWFEGDGHSKIMTGYGGVSGGGVTQRQTGATTMKTVYEWWHYNRDNEPCVEYQIDKCETYFDGPEGRQPPVINFFKKFGITRLPISWKPGLCWPGVSNWDDKVHPLPWAFLRNDLMLDKTATAIGTAFHRVGFPTWHAKPDPQAAALPESDIERDEPEPLVIEPLTIIRSNETLTQLTGAEVSRDGTLFLQFLASGAQAESPNLGGGNGGESAIAQSVSNRFSRDELNMIEKSMVEQYAECASFVFEAATCIGERYGPVVIPEQVDTPVGGFEKRDVQEQNILTIEPSWAGSPPNYAMSAIMPVDPKANLAYTQQLTELHDVGVVDMQFVHEKGLGLKDSIGMVVRVEDEKQRATPQGQAYFQEVVAKYEGDLDAADIAKAKRLQIISELLGLANGYAAGVPPQQAVPMDPSAGGMMMPPGAPQPFQGGGMTGMAAPNIAASQLGGIVAGAMGSGSQMNAEAAGAPLPTGPGGL